MESRDIESTPRRWIYAAAMVLVFLITDLSFYHGMMYPVTYWDSLIYYVHYGKMTYQQGGFPILYCLQVGLGLGANYPHLFPLHQAVTAILFNHWSDLYAQMIAPLAGLGSMILLYYLVVYLFEDRVTAILAVLAFRTVTFVNSYFIWTSDYALVMLYTCLFLLFLALFLDWESMAGLQPLLLTAAIFPHINYLGWIVWPCVALAVMLWWFRGMEYNGDRPHVLWVGLVVFAWCGLALIWYIRNYIVTGNPVYAFFPEIFGGKNINLDVLRSCEQEWLAHGNGVAGLGATLWERLQNTPFFLLTDWRPAPLTAGLFLPALLLWSKRFSKFFAVSALLLFLYLVYEYVISGLYLYHIIAIFPIFAVFTARFLSCVPGRVLPVLLGLCIVFMGVVPGLSFSLIGAKYGDPTLSMFAYPGLPANLFYQKTFPGVSTAWRYINDKVERGAGILSHENRYHVLRDDLRVIHLDDCGLTPFYGKSYPEVHAELLKRGVRYYFYIPDEDSHPITRQLGHREHLGNPAFYEKVFDRPVSEMGSDAPVVEIYRLVDLSISTPAGPSPAAAEAMPTPAAEILHATPEVTPQVTATPKPVKKEPTRTPTPRRRSR